MLNFSHIVESVLNSKQILNEMPALTPSLNVWVDKGVEEIVGRRGSGSIKDKEFTTYTKGIGDFGSVHKGDRFYFDKTASDVAKQMFLGLNGIEGITCEDFCSDSNLMHIINNTPKLSKATEENKYTIIEAIQNISKYVCVDKQQIIDRNIVRKLFNQEVFVELIVRNVLTQLFTVLFETNTDKKTYTNLYHNLNNRGQQVDWENVNISQSEEEFKKQIEYFLEDILVQVSKSYGLEFIRTAKAIDQTAKIISQARGAFISDWETKLKDYRRTL